MERHYEIPNTDNWKAIANKRSKLTGKQEIVDCDYQHIAFVPADWEESTIEIWADAYTSGYNEGYRVGELTGKHSVRYDLFKTLGLLDYAGKEPVRNHLSESD